MSNSQQPWKDYLINTILDATKYTGNTEPDVKIFSASMLGNDPLMNFLKLKYGSQSSKTFGANTLGSITHLGFEQAFQNQSQCETELSLSHTLDNNWIVSGTIDLVLNHYQMIVDWKVTTTTAIKKVRSEGRDSAYALQLGVYKWLIHKSKSLKYDTALAMVDKNFSYFKDTGFNQLELLKIPTYPIDEIEQMLYDKTNELDEYIKTDSTPPQCTNLFFFKPKGATRAQKYRCIHYCDNNINCPYYSDHSAMNSLLDL